MLTLYPTALKALLIYLEILGEADQKVADLNVDYLPFPKVIPLTDEEGSDWGELRDEVGGAWCWVTPGGAS